MFKTSAVLDIANSSNTHWRYAIVALRVLRTYIRRDEPISALEVQYFLDKTHDAHPSLVWIMILIREVWSSPRFYKFTEIC